MERKPAKSAIEAVDEQTPPGTAHANDIPIGNRCARGDIIIQAVPLCVIFLFAVN